MGTDDAPGDEVDTAGQEQQGGDLAGAAAHLAHQHVHEAGVGQSAGVHEVHGQGGGAGDGVSGGEAVVPEGGEQVRGHGHRVAQHQEGTAGQGGVHEVLAQAAEELLDHHDGEEIADDQHPVGQGHGADEGQQHAGDGGGQVAVGLGLVEELAVAPLKDLAGHHGDHGGDEGPGAEEVDRRAQGGHQGDQHVHHQGPGPDGRGDVGGGSYPQQLGFVAHALAASFAFCWSPRISNLAIRKVWTRWIRAGQM